MNESNNTYETANGTKPVLAAVKYEYSWDNKSSLQIVPRIEMFEERTKYGWELVTVIPDGNLHCFYWKRPINYR